jgi:hypothetical protein
MRRSILARVKFLSRLFTALNLLPSIATLASVNSPMARQRATKRADLADGATIALAEVGNRLVIRSKAARQPHHLDVAQSLTGFSGVEPLKTAARLNPVEIAVDVELEQH